MSVIGANGETSLVRLLVGTLIFTELVSENYDKQ